MTAASINWANEPVLAAIITLACLSLPVLAPASANDALIQEESERTPASPGAPRPMSFADILGESIVTHVDLSSDEHRVAFLVRRACVAQNDYVNTAYIMSVGRGDAQQVVASGANVANLRWRPHSAQISYLQGRDLITIDVDTRTKTEITLPASVGGFEWSPDGQFVATIEQAVGAEDEPFRIEAVDITQPRMHSGAASYVAVYSDIGTFICRTRVSYERVANLQWSPAARSLAFNRLSSDNDTGNAGYDTVMLGVNGQGCVEQKIISGRQFISFDATDRSVLVGAPSEAESGATFAMLRDGGTLTAFALAQDGGLSETGVVAEMPPPHNKGDYRADILNAWLTQSGRILEISSRSQGSLVRVSGHHEEVHSASGYRLSGCSIARTGTVAACVGEELLTPPEVVLVDLRTMAVRTLSHVNESLRRLELGDIEPIAIPDKQGAAVTMYVVYPLNYVRGKRYPTIVVLYGFNNSFVSQAQYITSYAPQVWASRGFVTLLWNPPRSRGGPVGDLDAQAADFQLNPCATIQHAVDWLVQNGIADPSRIGIAGHSMGSLWADYAIQHGTSFSAASSHSPGGYTPLAYWGETPWWRRRLDHIFGGPPQGPASPRWLSLSPPLWPAPAIPELREVGEQEVTKELDYRHWGESGGRVETWIYPGDGHVFSKPMNRLRSLELNTDWFQFWLMQIEDPSPEKRGQYARWHELRERQDKRPIG